FGYSRHDDAAHGGLPRAGTFPQQDRSTADNHDHRQRRKPAQGVCRVSRGRRLHPETIRDGTVNGGRSQSVRAEEGRGIRGGREEVTSDEPPALAGAESRQPKPIRQSGWAFTIDGGPPPSPSRRSPKPPACWLSESGPRTRCSSSAARI